MDDAFTLTVHSLATLSNVVGMISTKAGLSMQTAAMRVQWCVSPTNILPTIFQLFCRPLSVSIDKLDNADPPPIQETHIYPLGIQFLISLSDGFASYPFQYSCGLKATRLVIGGVCHNYGNQVRW